MLCYQWTERINSASKKLVHFFISPEFSNLAKVKPLSVLRKTVNEQPMITEC